MGRYARDEQVRIRIIGKIRLSDDENEENRLQYQLFRRLIAQAEDELHMDLSMRYAVPFQTDAGASFESLPDPTKELLRTMAELKAVITALETDFGMGSVVDASKYVTALEKRYEKILKKVVERRQYGGEETNQWKYPPLQGLKLAPHNFESDDGFAGPIHVTTQGDGGYPATQINDPSETFFNGVIDE